MSRASLAASMLNKKATRWPWMRVSLIINEEKPTITAIAGESGSGKTTLARLLLGIIQPTQRLDSVSGARPAEHEQEGAHGTFRRQVQAIFQDPFEAYNPFYKVDQVLTTPVQKFQLAPSQRGGAAADRGEFALGWPAPGGYAWGAIRTS